MKNSAVLNCAEDVMGLDRGEENKVSASVYGKSFIILESWKLVYRTLTNSAKTF